MTNSGKFKETSSTIFIVSYLLSWDNLYSAQCSVSSLYETFLNIFKEIYDVNFSLTEIAIKAKNLKTPWFSKGLKKSSKTQQRLYIKWLQLDSNPQPLSS